MSSAEGVIDQEWLAWLKDVERASRTISKDQPLEALDLQAQGMISFQFALYTRAVTLLGTCILLADHDRQLDMRIAARSVIECALHMKLAVDHPAHLEALKRDDRASRNSRASKFLHRAGAGVSKEDRKALMSFIAETKHDSRLDSKALEQTGFIALLHEHREISADSTHVTFSSLIRHIQYDKDDITRSIFDPALSHDELYQTLCQLGTASIMMPWLLIKCAPEISLDVDELGLLKERYTKLVEGLKTKLCDG